MTGLVFGSPQWLPVAAAIAGVGAVLTAWSYVRARGRGWVAPACAGLKLAGFGLLGLCLVEPLLTGLRPTPGANVFVLLADTSQSLRVRDGDAPRADWVKGLLAGNPPWRARLGQDFDARNYVFDTHLRGADGFDGLAFDGTASSLHSALAAVAKRYQGRPLAGVLLVSDGNATDAADIDWAGLPPVYPVLPPADSTPADVAVSRVALNQTNFEAAPVALQAEVRAVGFKGKPVVAAVMDEAGKEVEKQEATPAGDAETLNFRFQLRPDKTGVGFYTVRARLKSEASDKDDASAEQTLANNARLVTVDRGGGPYRVLYVGGRPNWEYKALRRAVADDPEVQLVGLVRVAKRQPKFDFGDTTRGRGNNQLFKGFDLGDPDTAEQKDQPVLIRLGTADAAELRAGFPLVAADLYRYHAVVLDDLEAGFFNPDQLALLRTFVTRRGGGFLMLGGPDSFAAGKYDRTPVGEMLPVYLDRTTNDPPAAEYRLALTREGWLQPWVRTRRTEDDESRRLAGMSGFETVNRVGPAKPGASVLAEVKNAAGTTLPALVAQPYGKGRSAAVLVGDLWRWGLRRSDPAEDDFERAWRQTVRWLVADVPSRVEARVASVDDVATPAVDLTVRAADPEYQPLDNAAVTVTITKPDKAELTLIAEPDAKEAGQYAARFVPREPGAYRAVATVAGPDGAAVGRREVGWCVQPEADEFARLEPNRELLKEVAARTGGETVEAADLPAFVAGLSSRKAPAMEVWTSPLWHRGWFFAVAIALLAAEWGIRRRHGLA
jgi:uncharacterized membrane protein